jgi:EthD domain
VARIQAQAPDAIVRGVVDAGLLGEETAHGQETSGVPRFAAAIHVSLADRDDFLVDAVRGVGADFGQFIDPARSAALAGGEHVIVPGEERLMLAMAIRRLPSLTHEQYVEHWSTVHAELGRKVPGSQGYRQVRPVEPLSRQVADTAGLGVADLDGVALAYYSDEEAFFSIMGNAEVTSSLLADEQTFIDHSASALVCGWMQRVGTG